MATEQLWVTGKAYHSSIVIPTATVAEQAPLLSDLFLEQQGLRPWLSFGWGDRDYYGASNKNLSKAAKALLWPTPSVMEVWHLETVGETGSWRIDCSHASLNMDVLLQSIVESFALSPDHHHHNPLHLQRSEPDGRYYYRALGSYHLWNNCNNWTLRMLQQAGLPVGFRTGFFAGSVKRRVAAVMAANQ